MWRDIVREGFTHLFRGNKTIRGGQPVALSLHNATGIKWCDRVLGILFMIIVNQFEMTLTDVDHIYIDYF